MREQIPYRSTSVRAIIRRGDDILVEWLPSKGIAFLPGGTVEEEESLKEALQRELGEEIQNAEFQIGAYRGRIGHRWTEKDGLNSCLNHFFEVHLEAPSDPHARESGRLLKWVSLKSEECLILQPPSLRELLSGDQETSWDATDDGVLMANSG
jgi:8-oxo-dGTP pyrophosphatase MutT (NUDIX family)